MIDSRFIVERQGKQFVLYAGLLDLAHKQGLRRISTRLIQVPSEDNGQTAICSAEVETDHGTFSGIGDASPANVARQMLTCTIRLSETRAKARALRDAVNVGVAALEELGDTDDETPTTRARTVVEAPSSTVVSSDTPEPLATALVRTSDNRLSEVPSRIPPTPLVRAAPPTVNADTPATADQRAAVERLAKAHRVTVDVASLTKTRASALIRELQGRAKKAS
jgi:hypothetical protein